MERFAEVFPVEVGIHFGGGNAGMAKHFLHGPQVGAAFHQVGGKGMPESMRRNIFGDASL
jgi:hypothetical protein